MTPTARIPFNAESNVRDDNGLSKVAYRATFKPADAAFVQAARAAQFGRQLPIAAASGDIRSIVAAVADYASQVRSDQANAEQTATFALRKFYERDNDLRRETLGSIQKAIHEPRTGPKAQFVDRFNLQTELRPEIARQPNGGLIESFKWNVTEDYFDIGLVEIAPGKRMEVSPGDIQPRYEMQLVVEATDTNFNTGPKVSRSEPISLLVVSPGDLLVEIGKDEERLGAKLDDALKKLAAARAKYEFVRTKTELGLPEELQAAAVRAKDALQDVAKARELVQGVGKDFRRIEQECVVNRLPENNLNQYGGWANRFDRVLGVAPQYPAVSKTEDYQLHDGVSDAKPFGTLTPKGMFPTTENRMNEGQTAFDANRYPDPTVVNTAAAMLRGLEEEVAFIRALIGEASTKEKLQIMLRSLLDRQKRIGQAIKTANADWVIGQFGVTPLIRGVGQQFLAKGEVKKIKQGINWRQFDGDTVTVKLVSSDPANVIVPAEIKLDFEKNQLEFEYEIRAGTKEGDYTITLTPQVGDAVKVSVQVK